jgi:hypothetical protein
MAKKLPEGTKASPHFHFLAGIMIRARKLANAALPKAAGQAMIKNRRNFTGLWQVVVKSNLS